MNTEELIAALMDEAAPLRLLDDDDPAKAALGPIIDQINGLRNPPLRPIPPPDIDPEVEGVKAKIPLRLSRTVRVA